MNETVFCSHSAKQEEAIFSEHKITALLTGIQYGKTTSGSYWMLRCLAEFPSLDNNFLVCAPTYKILQQSTLPSLLSVLSGLGEHHKAHSIFKVKGGGTIYIRSLNDADSIVGITNVRAGWIDEAGLVSLYAWENFQARCAFKDARILLTSSPYTQNWLYKEIIKSVKKGERTDEIKLIQASSDENPYFPKHEFARRKETMDPRRFRMVFGGNWERPEGLVFDCFDESTNICKPFQLPPDTKYIGGVDWGYRDPCCIMIRGYSPFGDVFEVSEFYKSGLKPSEVIETLRQKQIVWNVERFFCDPSRPEMIAEAQAKGVHALPANNAIQLGIDKYYELIQSRKYKIFDKMCPNLIDEIDSYHYAQDIDLGPDQSQRKGFELPVDSNNHALDCCRYITMGMTNRGLNNKHTPTTPNVMADGIPRRNKHALRVSLPGM